MEAKHYRHGQTQNAQAARLYLRASEAYSQSNGETTPLAARLDARKLCRQHLEAALALEPDYAPALGLLGRVALDDGHLEQAQILFIASLDAQPGQSQQYTNLGYWALKSERPAMAEQYFAQALELDRQSATAFCGVAHAKRLKAQFDVAYLHYRKLLEMGADWSSVYSGMLTCASHLAVHQADDDLARDAIALLRQDTLPHQQIGRFVGAILSAKYDLNVPDAQILLDTASEDELLILALQKVLMPSAAIEQFVGLLRRAVLAEVAQTAELRDELQPLALAIAQYAERTGYAIAARDDEQRMIDAINNSLQAQLALGEPQAALHGSLIMSAMYGALFHQAFAVQLGQWNLTDWPLAMQAVMVASYYDRANEEAIKQNFEEKAEELCLDKIDLPQAWPTWSNLSQQTETSLKKILIQELGLPAEDLPDTLRILVCGAQSGQRALELARYLSDVEVIAVDESLANVAKGGRVAAEIGLDNIVFWPWSIAQRFVADGHKLHWVEVGRLPSAAMTDLSLSALVNDATNAGAVVHLHTAITEQTRGDRQIRDLIKEHNLQPNRATLRQLRQLVLNNHDKTPWQDLAHEDDFFSLGGCRDRWFAPQDPDQLKQLLGLLSNEVEWKLIKARDAEGHSLSPKPVQRQIQAEAMGNEVQSLVGQGLSVYFSKRR
ncbi:hypothetical protein LPB19_14945 [Marinobacter salinisoli]|uniref:Tetratricopeptide repeat protein n=1 Tax=Marinobacter salinisoli TaxID=2769486 RepID=A0ABX7MQ73_9GAMM|nr:class I SAM-dependent methyltransferase [Marinobacter salinisoli]QSP94456.1 hypothetical protein LPB19_14945 [Marinobacter salinisoli]